MKLALAQMKMSGSVPDNLRKTVSYIAEAGKQGADLIFFPELQLTEFFPKNSGGAAEKFLMRPDGGELAEIRAACRENRIAASPNIYLEEGGGRYDASLMIDRSGEVLGISKMVHIASFPHFYEREYYTPSDTGFMVYELPAGGRICRVGIVICFDRHFPESIRCCALQGAELIIIPTANLTEEPQDMFLWELRVQAVQNCVNIAMCNRTGAEGEVQFSGRSAVIDYRGNVTAAAGSGEQLLFAGVDMASAAAERALSPYFTSRRPEKYRELAEIQDIPEEKRGINT